MYDLKWVQKWGWVAMIAVLSFSAHAKEDSPETVPGAQTIDVKQAKALFLQGVTFVDVRNNSDWEAGRIPTAVHLELKKVFSPTTLSKVVSKTEPVIFYCNSLKCHRAAKACAKAVSWGYQKVYYFRRGYPAWKNALEPIE